MRLVRLRRRAVVAVLAGTMVAGPLVAAAEEAAGPLRGVGASTCDEFMLRMRDSRDLWEFIYFSWAQGYLSGMNVAAGEGGGTRAVDQFADDFPVETQIEALRNFCVDNPEALYATAVADLQRRLPLPPE